MNSSVNSVETLRSSVRTGDPAFVLADQSGGPAPQRAGELPPQDFWSELNSTLDEFFKVINVSKDRLAELSNEIAKRDGLIAALQAQNVSLRARLGIAELGGLEKAAGLPPRPVSSVAQEPIAPPPAAPVGPGPARGIWQKLTTLEREH